MRAPLQTAFTSGHAIKGKADPCAWIRWGTAGNSTGMKEGSSEGLRKTKTGLSRRRLPGPPAVCVPSLFSPTDPQTYAARRWAGTAFFRTTCSGFRTRYDSDLPVSHRISRMEPPGDSPKQRIKVSAQLLTLLIGRSPSMP